MRKISLIAGLAAVSMSTAAFAQDSTFYFQVANQGGATCVSTAANTNATLYLAPASQDVALGIGSSYSTGSLLLRVDVATKGDGCGAEVLGSVGLDVNAVVSSGTGSLSATGWTWTNPGDWSGVNAPAVGGGATIVTDARAVAVPDMVGSVLWSGYCPGSHDVAVLDLSADSLGSGEAVVDLSLAISPLKTTRVYDPTATNGGAPEAVAFGYNGGVADATVSGSSVGATSANADATVIIRKKGDFGSFDPNSGAFLPVPDGSVDLPELPQFLAAVGSGDPLQQFLGDFGSFDPNSGAFFATPDCSVDLPELPQFLAAVGS